MHFLDFSSIQGPPAFLGSSWLSSIFTPRKCRPSPHAAISLVLNSSEKFCTLKDLGDQTGPIQITQDNFACLKVFNLNHICSLFYKVTYDSYSQVLGIRTQTSLGTVILPTTERLENAWLILSIPNSQFIYFFTDNYKLNW